MALSHRRYLFPRAAAAYVAAWCRKPWVRYSAAVNNSKATPWWVTASAVGTFNNSVAIPRATCRITSASNTCVALRKRGSKAAYLACAQ